MPYFNAWTDPGFGQGWYLVTPLLKQISKDGHL
jgi:hypothetical protein